MNKSKCPACGSNRTKNNGNRKGVQTYKCAEYGYQFHNARLPSDEYQWTRYLENKQTIDELAKEYKASVSTIKRRLRNIKLVWEQPPLEGGGFVHLDATYWGHN